MYRCDVGDDLAIEGVPQWSVTELTWRDAGVRYPTADFALAQRHTAEMVSRHCKASLHIVQTSANIVSRYRIIDGAQGVLARHELPQVYPPGSGSHVQLSGEWDSSERPSQRTLNVVTMHEIFHGLGLLHYNSKPSIMNSTLDPQWHDEIDDWTIDELRSRYGAPRTVVPVPDCGTWLDQLCAGLWQVPR